MNAGELLVPFFNTVFTQYGATVGLMMLIIGYLVRENWNERSAHEKTTDKLIAYTDIAAKSDAQVAEALRANVGTMQRLAEISSGNRQLLEKLTDRADRLDRLLERGRHDR